MINKITFEEAVNMVVNEGVNLFDTPNEIINFDLDSLIQTEVKDNRYFYEYDDIILEEVNADSDETEYYICDSNFNQIGFLGWTREYTGVTDLLCYC